MLAGRHQPFPLSRLQARRANSLSTGFLELIPPLVLKPPRTRGGINWVPHPKSKKFRLRRAKIIITRILIYLTARRRRKFLRICACKNTFFFAKTVLMCWKNKAFGWKINKFSKKILRRLRNPINSPLVLKPPRTRGELIQWGELIQGIRLISKIS